VAKQLDSRACPLVPLVHHRFGPCDVEFLRVELEALGFSGAVGADDHIEQQNAVLFTKDSIAAANDYLIAMFADKVHDLAIRKQYAISACMSN
jgi:hypothetical protein